MSGIFISYRRQDAQSAAGRLYDGLQLAYREKAIFRDVVKISSGVDFVKAIEQALESCSVLLAGIGPRWLKIADAAGARRLDDSNDITRREMEIALKYGVFVIPVLVDGAEMPAEQDLPDGLKSLAHLQAHDLSDKRWEYDLNTLVDRLAQLGELPVTGTLTFSGAWRRLLLVAIAGTAVCILYAAKPLARLAGIEDLVPEGLFDRASDGGTILVVLLSLIILGAFFRQHNAALTGVVGNWRRNRRTFAIISVSVLGAAILVGRGMLISGLALAAIAVTYLVLRRFASGFFVSAVRLTMSIGAAFLALAAAWWGDITIEASRENAYDVAFLLPPDGGRSAQAENIFKQLKEALDVSLKNVESMQIVPDHLFPVDFLRYDFAKQDALLAYKARQGFPRLFIRSKYNLDGRSDSLRILVTLYKRAAGRKGIQPLSDWTHPAWEAHSTPNETYKVALQAAFDVVSFLSSEKLIKLRPDEQQKFWQDLLEEYSQLLAVTGAENEEVRQILSAGEALDESKVRRVLFARPGNEQGESTASASNKEIDTATTLYSSTFAH
jgi:TIR domain